MPQPSACAHDKKVRGQNSITRGASVRNTVFLGAVALLAGSTMAEAADVALPPYQLRAPAVYDWTGFYIGGNAGVSATVTPLTQRSPGGVVNASTHNAFGAIGGVQAGYNQQTGRIVSGIEGDFQFSGQKSDPTCYTFCDFNFQNPAAVGFDSVSHAIPWFATLRGRVGYAAGPALFYVTAGGALAKVDTTFSTSSLPPFSGTASETRLGAAVGGGIEAALWGNWTAKVEYLLLAYGGGDTQFTRSVFGFPIVTTVSGNVTDHIARAGLNYRFGDPAPAAAPAMPTKAPPIAPAAYNWSGFYIGGNAGYSVGRDPLQENVFGLFGNSNQTVTLVPNGVLGGGQAGYNVALTNWLLAGVEADYQLANQRDTACFSFCIPTSGRTIYSQSMQWFATARGRAGITSGPFLLYATGGAAWTTVDSTGTEINTLTTINGTTFFTGTGAFSDQKSGWVAGGGAEGVLGGNWTAKVEYLYMDFGSITHIYPSAGFNLADPNVHFSTKVRDSVFRVGVNYHFSGGPPIVSANY
jgi:outer membrane immunogenic protein